MPDEQDTDQQQVVGRSYTIQQKAFFRSEAAILARIELKAMVNNPTYNTTDTFSARQSRDLSFVERHLVYLSEHPKLNPRHYLSNLRLMTKIKR